MMMIDARTLESIKNNNFAEGTNFQEELHCLIHDFYKNFDLDILDEKYRETYIRSFIQQHEAFLVNYETNVLNVNIKNTDKLSSELTLNKFLSTLAEYLTKFHDEDGKDHHRFSEKRNIKNG